jgi:hypothetical protein
MGFLSLLLELSVYFLVVTYETHIFSIYAIKATVGYDSLIYGRRKLKNQ